MTVLTVTIADQSAFDKKSSEITYLQRVIDLLKNEIGRSHGTVTSGTILGTNPAGVANSSLGSWTYVSSASNP
jgi:hypothetical protein